MIENKLKAKLLECILYCFYKAAKEVKDGQALVDEKRFRELLKENLICKK